MAMLDINMINLAQQLVKPGYFQKISCMAAGAALLAMLDILLCHAQQQINLNI
jgi:hypothetical protein